tara:strand:- start:119 stop:280 length:162 start_codon:yes stop_codon:yes gene_type:complete
MKKLENVINKTLDKFKASSVNLLSESARKVLASAIAEDIRTEVEKERKKKLCN